MFTYNKKDRDRLKEIRLSDPKLHGIKIIIIFSVVYFLYKVVTMPNHQIGNDILFSNLFGEHHDIWRDRFHDGIYPIIVGLSISLVYYNDYKDNIYELLTFYNQGNYNKNIFSRWIFYTLLFLIIDLLSILLSYYRNIVSLESIFILLFRFTIPLLFISSICLFTIVFFKNTLLPMGIIVVYLAVDIFSYGRMMKILTLIMDSLYIENISYFISNRIIILILSLILIALSMKKSTRL